MKTSLKTLAAAGEIKKTDLYRVDPRMLYEEPQFNLRTYEDPDVDAQIEGFAHSYANGHYVPPLIVRVDDEGRIAIVEGHLRRRGALRAIERGCDLPYLDSVPFKGNDAERVEVMLRSAEGLKLKPLGVAIGYLRLQRMGYDNAKIAQAMHKTASHVEQMLVLATANHDVHRLVASGAVAAHTAIEVVRKHGEKAGRFLQQQLDAAMASGKHKVTSGSIEGRALPRKIVHTVVSSVESFAKRLDRSTLRAIAELETLAPEQIKGKKIEIDAAALLDLMKAKGAMDDAKAKQQQRAHDGAQAAKQTAIAA